MVCMSLKDLLNRLFKCKPPEPKTEIEKIIKQQDDYVT
jgi:hypothetical protein